MIPGILGFETLVVACGIGFKQRTNIKESHAAMHHSHARFS